MMHLRYNMMEAGMNYSENRHPQKVMEELGITYQHATPQSMGDQWWFWNCKIPAPVKLPKYLTKLGIKPHEAIGYGLNSELADAIAAEEKAQ